MGEPSVLVSLPPPLLSLAFLGVLGSRVPGLLSVRRCARYVSGRVASYHLCPFDLLSACPSPCGEGPEELPTTPFGSFPGPFPQLTHISTDTSVPARVCPIATPKTTTFFITHALYVPYHTHYTFVPSVARAYPRSFFVAVVCRKCRNLLL